MPDAELANYGRLAESALAEAGVVLKGPQVEGLVLGCSVGICVPSFLPWFLFFLILTSLGGIEAQTAAVASAASGWLLVAAIGAAGIKTNFADLMKLGWRPVVMLLSEGY